MRCEWIYSAGLGALNGLERGRGLASAIEWDLAISNAAEHRAGANRRKSNEHNAQSLGAWRKCWPDPIVL